MTPGTDHRPAGPANPLRGLRWGLVIAVVAALVLFAGVLVVEDGRSGGTGTPAAGPGTSAPPAASGPTASGPTASGPTASGPTASGPTASGPTASGPTASGSAPSGPTGSDPAASGPAASGLPTAPGAIVAGGILATGWESRGWSWDSAVRVGGRGPGGTGAVAVTYRTRWAGFALRQGGSTRPAATARLRVRVYLPGPAARLGLQVQSSDGGGLGPVVQRDVPTGRWVTLTATVAELAPPAGVRRVSVIAQDVPPGTVVWVSDVTLR